MGRRYHTSRLNVYKRKVGSFDSLVLSTAAAVLCVLPSSLSSYSLVITSHFLANNFVHSTGQSWDLFLSSLHFIKSRAHLPFKYISMVFLITLSIIHVLVEVF